MAGGWEDDETNHGEFERAIEAVINTLSVLGFKHERAAAAAPGLIDRVTWLSHPGGSLTPSAAARVIDEILRFAQQRGVMDIPAVVRPRPTPPAIQLEDDGA